MSTIYAFNAETSTSLSANDTIPIFKTSTGRTMKVHASAIQTYILGQGTSSGTVGFYGATATAQPVAVTNVTATAVASVTATQWGFSTSTQGDALIALVRGIRANLISLGLIA